MSPTRPDLHEQRRAALARAVTALHGNDEELARSELRTVQTCDLALAAQPQERKSPWPTVVTIAGGTAVIVILLWSIPKSVFAPSQYTVDIHASAMTLKWSAPAEGVAEGDIDMVLDGTSLEVQRLESVQSAMLTKSFTRGDARLTLSEGKVSLRRVKIQYPARMTLTAMGSNLGMAFHSKHVEAEALVEGSAVTLRQAESAAAAAKTTTLAASIPESIRVQAEDRDSVPMELRIHASSPWTLAHVFPDDVQFLEPSGLGEEGSLFISTIRRGEVRVLDIARTHALQPGDELHFGGLTTRRCEITVSGDDVHLRLEGTARSVLAGPSGLGQELRPYLLEIFYQDEVFKRIIAALVSVWGLLWGIQKLSSSRSS